MKRRIFIVAIFLLAGITVNVAVAWGCAYRNRSGDRQDISWGRCKCRCDLW